MSFKRSVSKRSKKNKNSKNNKNQSVLSKVRSNKPAVLMVIAFASFGIFLLSRSNAATSNFEAESTEVKNGATVLSDDSGASSGKYVRFATENASQVSNFSRFPGDPNPLVTGKAYWGAGVGGNDDPKPRHETPTGASLSVRRTFWGWKDRASKMPQIAKDDLASNRLPWISIKTANNSSSDWPKMADGTYDSQIDEMLIALDSIGDKNKPVWFTIFHEPENDGGSAAAWRGMQSKIRERMNALKSQGHPMDNISFAPILMSWTYVPSSGRNPNDWWVDGIWDFYGVDPYCYTTCSSKNKSLLTLGEWDAFVNFAKGKNIPMAVGEWGDTNSAPVAAQNMRAWWSWAFENKVDVIGYAAFDSGLNPPAGTTIDTTLHDESLATFQDILKNDSRVMRVRDLNKPIITRDDNYGIVSAQISIPSNSTYKLWLRLNSLASNKDLLSIQVDNGAVMRIGGSSLAPNIWTWVDWKNDKNTDKLTMSLSAGKHTIDIIGLSPGVMLDRVLVTNESCQPTGTGDNCAIINPPVSNMDVGISQPIEDQVISGVTNVVVDPSVNIQEVSFRVDNKWQTTVSARPFVWQWDTARFKEGPATLTIRARKIGDPGNKYTEKSIVVNIANKKVEPTPEPVDTIAPTKPEGLSINATPVYAWTVSKITYKLTWKASTDDIGVAGYVIERDGVVMGQTSALSFTDKTNTYTKTPYVYTVSAVDGNNNISKKATITATTTCQFIWCSTTVK